MELFIKWTQSLVDSIDIERDKHIAIDGKVRQLEQLLIKLIMVTYHM